MPASARKKKLKWEPVHIDKAFALGETTRKDGTTYVSAITNNVCIPGECNTGRHEVDDDDTGEQLSAPYPANLIASCGLPSTASLPWLVPSSSPSLLPPSEAN